ncbi:hypothetical protein BDZ89DRAFT_443970 [Hymenopellis radicata]|nr:hypothetical protein BDZ89DRAFT_443970 [Hymenopellis radicata]
MPPRVVLLKVHATYTSPKAEMCSTSMLMKDLDVLDFVRPKRSSIKVVGPGVIEFGWETEEYSMLHNTLLATLKGETGFGRYELPKGRRLHRVTDEELKRLGMLSLELLESFVSAPGECREEPSTLRSPTMSPPRRRHRSRSRSRSPERNSTGSQMTASRLLQELADTRQLIKELASYETLLQNQNHSGLPFEPDMPPDIFLMRSRLRSVKMEAEKERKIMEECGDALEDVKRDRRAPFKSPVVLDLFVFVCRLTSDTADL